MHHSAQVDDCENSKRLPIRKEEEAVPPAAPDVDTDALLSVDDFDFLSKLGIDQ